MPHEMELAELGEGNVEDPTNYRPILSTIHEIYAGIIHKILAAG